MIHQGIPLIEKLSKDLVEIHEKTKKYTNTLIKSMFDHLSSPELNLEQIIEVTHKLNYLEKIFGEFVEGDGKSVTVPVFIINKEVN